MTSMLLNIKIPTANILRTDVFSKTDEAKSEEMLLNDERMDGNAKSGMNLTNESKLTSNIIDGPKGRLSHLVPSVIKAWL